MNKALVTLKSRLTSLYNCKLEHICLNCIGKRCAAPQGCHDNWDSGPGWETIVAVAFALREAGLEPENVAATIRSQARDYDEKEFKIDTSFGNERGFGGCVRGEHLLEIATQLLKSQSGTALK